MKKIEIDSFKDHCYVSQLTRSPRGRYLAYILSGVNMDQDKYTSHIFVKDLEEKKEFQLTNGKTGESSFLFLDEYTILFQTDREDDDKRNEFLPKSCFYRINLNGGEAILDLELDLAVEKLLPVADDEYLILANYRPLLQGFDDLAGEDKAKREKELKEEKDYEVLSEIPFWNDGGDYSRGQRTRLYHYKRGDSKAKALTDETTNAGGLELSPDGHTAVYLQSSYTNKMPLESRLMLLDLNSLQAVDISPFDDFSYEHIAYLSDGLVFAGTDRKKYGLNQDVDLFYLSLDGKEAKKIVPDDFDLSLWNSVGSDSRQGGGYQMKSDGSYFYFITTEGICSHLNRIDKSGNFKRLTKMDGSVECFDVLHGDVYLSAFRGQDLPELYHLSEDGTENCLSDFNPYLRDFELGTIEEFYYEYGEDSLRAFVVLPPDYDAARKYPAILTIHGGPKTVFGTIFFHEMQYLAAQGYIVFYTNPRGSDGQGRDWADIRGRYGEVEYEQLMALTDEVLCRYPAIDVQRLGVTGGSYGGYMTNWIVGHTDRFKAAVTQRSISNMISMFAISDIGYYFIDDQSGTDPWTDADELWRQSPLKYANRIKTPTLIIHSDQDYRCPLAEGMQFFTALKFHGVDSRMVIFKGESHGLSRGGKPKHRIRRLREISDWFDKYLNQN